MYTTHLLQQNSGASVFDPTAGASRMGYREIAGDVPSTGQRTSLHCHAIVFDEESAAFDRYREIVTVLGSVDGNGLAISRLPYLDADRFGSMSERTDTLGEVTTLWVTGTSAGGEKRGAVLAAVNGQLIQLLALGEYKAVGKDRATYLLEHLAHAMSARQTELELEPWAATMSYLPLLQDVGKLMLNTEITSNRYGPPPLGW